MGDRRKLERLSPLVIRTEFPGDPDRRHGYMTNLSEAGAFLATDEELTVGETIQVHFFLPWGLGEYDATATVIWRSADMGHASEAVPTGVGLYFTDLGNEARAGIRIYMQRFFEILAEIEERGLSEVLMKLAATRSETVH